MATTNSFMLCACFALLLVINGVYADVYMHNPRGSNNRVDDANNAPANRLFDAQNNNQAGYNAGEEGVNMKYYASSVLPIQFSMGHGCGNDPAIDCVAVIQYRCDTLMRNGVSRERPEDDLPTADSEPSVDRGRHEPYSNWLDCKTRARNGGLFIADQNVGDQARNTRQNAGGGRSGYECAEERDYYPYWHPSPWQDIAVLASNTSRCDYYQAESQNVKPKGFCSDPALNNPAACTSAGGSWSEQPAFGLPAPDCMAAPWTMVNSYNGIEVEADGRPTLDIYGYNWTVPDSPSAACVVRLRYNMSTYDYDGWNTYAGGNLALTNDPEVDVGIAGTQLQLNINTAQFGRTFEDRTHIFEILSRPASVADTATIYNLNVRGKRGNNAATHPSCEYDFVPKHLWVRPADYVHFQWTGSENNNNGNDRHNVVQISYEGSNYPLPVADMNMFPDVNQRNSAASSCGSADPNLQDVTPYCDVGLVQFPTEGTYRYMSTKNNAFSNRRHKGSIVVSTEDPLAFLNQQASGDGDCGSLSHGAWIGLTVGLGVLCLVLLVVAIVACVCAATRRTTSKEYGPQSDL